ncbi:MAG: DUF6916 family protein [Actinomycetota bacterium]
MTELSTLTFANFSSHTGRAFQLRAENGECPLVLKEVRDASRYARSGARIPFSLIFSGPPGVSFQQGSYTLEHEKLGELLLFLVPIGIENGAIQLEAVFN